MKLLQISDTHLFADPATRHKGFDVDGAFERVLDHLLAHHPECALLLVTGDLAHDEAETTYRRLGARLARLPFPVEALTGNHDIPELARRVLGEQGIGVNGARELPGLRVMLLNSSCPGEVGGELGDGELARLEEWLERDPATPALVALHHPPLPLGTPWLDAIGLRDGERLQELLGRHRQVRALLFGHAHQSHDLERHGLRLLGTPSTNRQFARGGDECHFDDLPPAYRWLDLATDGSLATGIEWLPTATC